MVKHLLLFFTLIISVESGGQPLNFQRSFLDFFSTGIRINTNGLGINYRKGAFINRHTRRFYEIEFTTIKDPRTVKFYNPFYIAPEKIFFGKVNDLFDLRFGYGKQKIIIEKKDKGSLEIRINNSFGPVLAIIKPTYYNVVDRTGTYTFYTKFTDDLLLQQVLNMAPFYKGLDEIKPNFGGFYKIGISFEHSKNKNNLNALELGASLSAFIYPIELVYNKKHLFFLNIFIAYRLGKFFPQKLRHKKREQTYK